MVPDGVKKCVRAPGRAVRVQLFISMSKSPVICCIFATPRSSSLLPPPACRHFSARPRGCSAGWPSSQTRKWPTQAALSSSGKTTPSATLCACELQALQGPVSVGVASLRPGHIRLVGVGGLPRGTGRSQKAGGDSAYRAF